ncbi:MAG: (d)CMP kinase [Chlorobi bacterium]|nr:(d)CMP kinase [Chlorobiota bacterium]
MSKNLIIAIDGPAGSGKSTLAKNLAEKLNSVYVDTGAMYRAITYLALRNKIADDEAAVIKMTRGLNIKLQYKDGLTHVLVNGEEVTDFIRTAEVNAKVSDISRIPEVRAELVKIQRRMGEANTLVAEGRDVTTVVFPDAEIKIFLTADLDVRTERRLKEYREKGDSQITFEEVKTNLAERDKIDSGRAVSPLKKADDAFELDSTNISIGDELNIVLNKINKIKEKV